MRVLHINAGKMYGGVETFLVTLARHGSRCPEMESCFASCFPGRFTEELTAAGAAVYPLGQVRASRFWTVWEARRTLRDLLRRTSCDAVICHMPWNHAVFAPEVKRAGKPLVFWQHGLAVGRGWVEGWARRARPDLAISNSQFTAGSLPLLFPRVPTKVIYYPVTPPEVRPIEALTLRQELGVSKDTAIVTQVSRMEAWKGHSLHLRALAQLKDLRGWICWMVGGAQRDQEHEYVNHLKQEADHLGIGDRVQFLGQRADVARVLAASDIFCQPNESPEPFGIVFVEALWAGLPVVTTRMGGGAEIVTEGVGCLAEPGDPSSVADGLRRLLSSPEQRRVLGSRGPDRARSLCNPADQIGQLHQALTVLSGLPVSGPPRS
jgi:glycosyltransferase involved in cell wall biosynthesis